MTVELFTSSQCEGCELLKKQLKKEKIKFKEIDIDSEKGWKYMSELGINTVPVIKMGNRLIVAPMSGEKIRNLRNRDV